MYYYVHRRLAELSVISTVVLSYVKHRGFVCSVVQARELTGYSVQEAAHMMATHTVAANALKY